MRSKVLFEKDTRTCHPWYVSVFDREPHDEALARIEHSFGGFPFWCGNRTKVRLENALDREGVPHRVMEEEIR